MIKKIQMIKKSLSVKWLIFKSGVEKFVVKSFPIFVPSSAGNYKIQGFHTIIGINTLFILITKILQNLKINVKIININKFKNNSNAKKLKYLFNKYGSDKSKIHNYHLIYGSLFRKIKNVKKILEIGLGTNNENIISNMGSKGYPGASIRAFRDFFNKATIYGADIDKNILFNETRIKTFVADQTNLNDLKNIFKKTKGNYDLIIDDGLHAPYANVSVIIVTLKYLKKEGYLIIEDIPFKAKPIWEVISNILNKKYNTFLVKTKKNYVFIIKKI